MSFVIPDPRWEEPSLLVPGKKPIEPVKIDWSNPLSRGLNICMVPGAGGNLFKNIATENPQQLDASQSDFIVDYDERGAYLYKTSLTQRGFRFENPTLGDSPRTLLIGAKNISITDVGYLEMGINTTGRRWSFRSSAARLRIEIQGSGSESTNDMRRTGGFDVFGVTLNGSTIGSHRFFMNGLLEQASGDAIVDTAPGPAGAYGNQDVFARDGVNDKVYFFYFWSRALSDEEFLRLFRNPYQFLIPA